MYRKGTEKMTHNSSSIRKLAAIALVVIMLAAILTGCGSAAGAAGSDIITSVVKGSAEDTAAVAKVATEAEAPAASLKDAKTGDTVKFGKFEQDGNADNGVEDIEWTVICKDGGMICLISKVGLAAKAYNESEDGASHNTSWEKCSLRKWLNEDFFGAAFSDDEKKSVPTVKVVNYDTNTEDKVYLLSIAEAQSAGYAMDAPEKRMTQASAAAISAGAVTYTDSQNGGLTTCSWWLRSAGAGSTLAAYVHFNGSVMVSGRAAETADRAVRPVIWVYVGE